MHRPQTTARSPRPLRTKHCQQPRDARCDRRRQVVAVALVLCRVGHFDVGAVGIAGSGFAFLGGTGGGVAGSKSLDDHLRNATVPRADSPNLSHVESCLGTSGTASPVTAVKQWSHTRASSPMLASVVRIVEHAAQHTLPQRRQLPCTVGRDALTSAAPRRCALRTTTKPSSMSKHHVRHRSRTSRASLTGTTARSRQTTRASACRRCHETRRMASVHQHCHNGVAHARSTRQQSRPIPRQLAGQRRRRAPRRSTGASTFYITGKQRCETRVAQHNTLLAPLHRRIDARRYKVELGTRAHTHRDRIAAHRCTRPTQSDGKAVQLAERDVSAAGRRHARRCAPRRESSHRARPPTWRQQLC
jgi:hypothetical protein